MKNIKRKTILFISSILFSTNSLFGTIGCMDNSYHIKQKFDHKRYHYVQCNCPCHKYINSFVKGVCPQCGHYHDPRDFEVLTYADINALEIQETTTKTSHECCQCLPCAP